MKRPADGLCRPFPCIELRVYFSVRSALSGVFSLESAGGIDN